MIVRNIMQTKLVTVELNDTLGHSAGLLRQYQYHYLPVVQRLRISQTSQQHASYQQPILVFKGFISTQHIDMLVALAQPVETNNRLAQPWQERKVAEILQSSTLSLSPGTPVAAAAQLMVEQGIHCLPVIEPDQEHTEAGERLVGLVTRSDLLLALARALGAFEPGTQVTIHLPNGQMAPLAKALLAADALHIGVNRVLVAPLQPAHIQLRTINPAPFFIHLEQEGILYTAGDEEMESNNDVTHHY